MYRFIHLFYFIILIIIALRRIEERVLTDPVTEVDRLVPVAVPGGDWRPGLDQDGDQPGADLQLAHAGQVQRSPPHRAR